MMPESLLNELEQTAQRTSVREALMLAYFHGKSDGLGEALQDVTRVTQQQPETKGLDRWLEWRGGCFEEPAND